jgi:hypothetical protein
VSRPDESSEQVGYFLSGDVVVGAGAAGFALSDFALSGFAGAPRSEVGTFGGAGLSPSHPTAQAPTQSVRTNANGFRIVVTLCC